MFNSYNTKKTVYTIIEKYEIVKQLRSIKKILYLIVVTWISSSLLTILNEYLLSPINNRNLSDYLNFFLLNVKVILTGDFSDFEHLTFITLITSILMVVVGIVVIGMLTGQIISAIMLASEKNKFIPAKPSNFDFRFPLIICSINDRIFDILREIKLNPLSKNREIVIIDEKADKLEITSNYKEILNNVYYLKGNPADREILKKVITKSVIKNAKLKPISAIVLSNPQLGRISDQRAIETSLAIESFDETVYTLVEFQEQKHMQYLEKTKIDEMISVNEYGYKLLSQASLNLGITKVYNELLRAKKLTQSGKSISILFNNIPKQLEGKSYKNIKDLIYEYGVENDTIFLGFKKEITNIKLNSDIEELLESKSNKSNIIIINPKKQTQYMFNDFGINKFDGVVFITQDTVLNNGDKLIYINNT